MHGSKQSPLTVKNKEIQIFINGKNNINRIDNKSNEIEHRSYSIYGGSKKNSNSNINSSKINYNNNNVNHSLSLPGGKKK